MPRRRRGKDSRHDAAAPRDEAPRGSDGGKRSLRVGAAVSAASAASPSADAQLLFPREWVGCALLAAAAAAAYAPVFRAGFVWDDYIIRNLCESDLGLLDLWLRPSLFGDEPHYWPATYTLFWAECELWGTDPLGYHVVNLALHVANGCLVRRLVRSLGASDGAAWLAAAAFVLHPTRVESVAWAIELKDVLSGLFYLLALLRHPNVVGGPRGTGGGDGGGADDVVFPRPLFESLGLFILAMLSKSIVVSLPVVLLLIPWMVRGRVTALEARRSVPFFAAGLLVTGFDVYMYKASDGKVDFGLTLEQRILIASRALCSYLWQLVWPAEFWVVYPLWNTEENILLWAGSVLAAASASAAALFVLAKSARPGGAAAAAAEKGPARLARRVPTAAFVYFGATLSPALCLIDYGYMRFSYMADRFAYLAAIGPIALFAVAAMGGERGKGAHVPPFCWAIMLAVLGSLSYQRASIYETEVAFYEHIVRINTSAYAMWTNLGHAYARQDRDAEAVECYERSIRDRTDFPYQNLGKVLTKLGRTEEALDARRKAAKINPAKGEVWAELGDTYRNMSLYAEAAESYEESMRRSLSTFDAYTNYGIVLRKLGRTEEATGVLLKGLEETSTKDRKKSLNELGNAMSELGKYDEAVTYFRQALEIDPTYAIGWNNLASDLFRAGKEDDAVEAYRRAFELNPNYDKARLNCAIVLGSLSRHKEQVEVLRELLKRTPGYKNAKEMLDEALTKLQ